MLPDCHLKIAYVPAGPNHFRHRINVNITLAANMFDQLAQLFLSRALAGEDLVQLCHTAADEGGLLYQRHPQTSPCIVPGRA